ncbi:ATP-binding protein [Moraxella marmotae]|uniref:ATP-binding protein n=1 Tax=Moraxella marmotae TaxID=3344520 RepID=UPI0035F25CEB
MPINTGNQPIKPDVNASQIPATQQTKKPAIEFELSRALYTISDLILPEKTKAELKRAIGLRQYQKEVFCDWGFATTHKYDNKMIINLYGEPGTGKTMAAHAIACALGKPLVIVNYGDIESKYVGETPKNIQAVFEFAKRNDAVLFFDEADAILSRRVTNMSSATDTSVNQTRSVMLTLLNDYNDTVLFATNFISNYDPAFMRRILMHIEFTLPDAQTRKMLFEKYIPRQLPHRIDVDKLIASSEGLSGSDIANAMLLAAFSAKSDQRDFVSHEDLESKIQSILQSKRVNANNSIIDVKQRIVSEEYVKSQLEHGENT